MRYYYQNHYYQNDYYTPAQGGPYPARDGGVETVVANRTEMSLDEVNLLSESEILDHINALYGQRGLDFIRNEDSKGRTAHDAAKWILVRPFRWKDAETFFLREAARKIELVELWLSAKGIDINAPINQFGDTPLHIFCAHFFYPGRISKDVLALLKKNNFFEYLLIRALRGRFDVKSCDILDPCHIDVAEFEFRCLEMRFERNFNFEFC